MDTLNEAESRRLEALRFAMGPIIPYLDDDRVIEIALNADGSIWVERHGEVMARTKARMSNADAMRMLLLVASHMNTELTPAKPSLAALIPGWQTRLQAMIPPVVEGPDLHDPKTPKADLHPRQLRRARHRLRRARPTSFAAPSLIAPTSSSVAPPAPARPLSRTPSSTRSRPRPAIGSTSSRTCASSSARRRTSSKSSSRNPSTVGSEPSWTRSGRGQTGSSSAR